MTATGTSTNRRTWPRRVTGSAPVDRLQIDEWDLDGSTFGRLLNESGNPSKLNEIRVCEQPGSESTLDTYNFGL